MNVDDRLRRALHDEVDGIEPDPRSWSRVETGVRRARRRRRAGAALATAAVVVAALVTVPGLLDRDDARVETTPARQGATSSTTTSVVVTSTTTTVTSPADNDVTTAIWPFTTQDELDAYEASPGVGMFFDPEATALELARTYLGMPDPVRDGAVDVSGDDRAVVRVRPKPASPVLTVVSLQRFDGANGPWSVIGTTTEHIELDVPETGARVASPVHV
ncbi:MAG: hypothetical protein QOD30_2020, partial [Actinomycetota bacterium]|nr:hypothetical protein [Actinomycetota bacterium]